MGAVPAVSDGSQVSALLLSELQLGVDLLTELVTGLESLFRLLLSLAVDFGLSRQQLHLHKDTHTHTYACSNKC